uniref:IQ domain-containing protein C n=1 Tax=Geotrypetes seraphini TaxID=260995 RepID=A0A6P8S438_GEOSA|nr:IQ domain-containing protein C [Geotrypetes seraphini]
MERRARATALQAHIRGFLVRKKMQRLREHYESVVKEIEGDLLSLHWVGRLIPRPLFSQTRFCSKFAQLTRHTEPKSAVKLAQDEEAISKSLGKSEEVISALKTEEPAKEVAAPNQQHKATTLWKDCSGTKSSPATVTEEDTEHLNSSNESSVWGSTVLETGSTVGKDGLLCSKGEEVVPRHVSELRHHQNHLAMELLWFQQAITSRKNYLSLKQNLGTPE